MKTVKRRGANHVLHLVLTLLTFGIWAFTGWPIAAMMGRKTTVHHTGPQYFPPQYPSGVQPYLPPTPPVQWPTAPNAYTRTGTPTHPIPNNPYAQGP